jgi:threonylcarbamoyladenosine tRNA methylthiotransferase MtaB
VVPNDRKDLLVPEILELPAEQFDQEFIERQPVPGIRLRTRAFIKVQDGCDNRCTFCVTTLARGKGRSRTVAEVLSDIRAAVAGGAKEIVLSGVHLGSWGHDFSTPSNLEHLVGKILEKSDIPRVRLSSLEPWDLDPGFFDLWQDERLCRHLHLPLQSGCGTTLRRMARKTTPNAFVDLVEAARSRIPGVAITTDVIVGFPGESTEEFEESLSFVAKMKFADGHIFTYSARPGTAAALMPLQVPHTMRKERNAKMRAVIEESSYAFKNQFLEKDLTVLWENASALGPKGWQMNGLTDNYLRVYSLGNKSLWNELTTVRLERVEDHRIFGSILTPQPEML